MSQFFNSAKIARRVRLVVCDFRHRNARELNRAGIAVLSGRRPNETLVDGVRLLTATSVSAPLPSTTQRRTEGQAIAVYSAAPPISCGHGT